MVPISFEHVMNAWNERDPEAIRSHLDQALSDDVTFVDPTIETTGIAEFEANIRQFRAKYPDATVALTSGIDSHHDCHRYGWDIQVGGQVVVGGFDVAQVDATSKICRVIGFFGPLPPLSG